MQYSKPCYNAISAIRKSCYTANRAILESMLYSNSSDIVNHAILQSVLYANRAILQFEDIAILAIATVNNVGGFVLGYC